MPDNYCFTVIVSFCYTSFGIQLGLKMITDIFLKYITACTMYMCNSAFNC